MNAKCGPTDRGDCYSCQWDDRARENGEDLPESCEALLEDPRYCQLGAPNPFSDGEAAWWAEQTPHALAWLGEVFAAGLSACPYLPRFAATCLLSVPEQRAMGTMPGQPRRTPYCWDEIDAHEVLYDYLAHIGGSDYEPEALLGSMQSFAAFLVRRGVITSDLDRDLAKAMPTALPILRGEVSRLPRRPSTSRRSRAPAL